MIDFGQSQIIEEKIHYSKYHDVIISSCVRNYEYLIGDSNVDTAESIPTKVKIMNAHESKYLPPLTYIQ